MLRRMDAKAKRGSGSSRRGRLALAAALLLMVVVLARPAPCQAQAEAAPPGTVPGWQPPPPPGFQPPPRLRLGANVRFAWLLGDTPQVAPSLGWGFGLQLSASLLPLGRVRLGFVIDFAQDRLSRGFDAVGALYVGAQQELVHSTFAAQALLDAPIGSGGRWRPFLSAGVGGSVVRHTATLPTTCPIDQCPAQKVLDEALVPLFRFSAGLYFAPLRALDVGLGVDFSVTVSDLRGGLAQQADRVSAAQGTLFSPGYGSLWLAAGYRFY